MRRAVWGLALLLGTAYRAGRAQTEDSAGTQGAAAARSAAGAPASSEAPQFDVATIKPSDPKNCCGYFWNVDGMRFKTVNTNLRWLIRFAYGLNDKQIAGEPGWTDDTLYDVTAAFAGTKPPSDLQC
ncbi:MAG TPA: TIGR03435 family protein, partial [Acidobacteriaceae bacterium]|nr:TIGR03435 family protein [Acidobacteriaceae bacterium]